MRTKSETPTIQDVAEEAQCSAPTVSRVLNHNGYVSEETRKAVLDAAARIGYVRSPGRREAKTDKRPRDKYIEVIGSRHSAWEPELHFEHGFLDGGSPASPKDGQIFPTQLHSPLGGFFAKTCYSMMEEAREAGYRVVFRGSSDPASDKLIREVNCENCCGVIVLGQDTPELSRLIERSTKPVVLLGMVQDIGADMLITVDNHLAMSQAVDHLVSLGHTDIGFINGDPGMSELVERYDCFAFELLKRKIACRPEWTNKGGELFADTVAQAKEILSLPQRPTALMCCNDQAALSVIRAAGELGISVPGELSVVGLDNTDASAMATPALTTVAIPFDQMAREAIFRLVAKSEVMNDDFSAQLSQCRLMVKPQLIIRNSTAECAVMEKTGKNSF